MTNFQALALFSGGLDSILAARTLQAQGLRVLCLHYVSPFFGHPERVDHWQRVYGLEVAVVDVAAEWTAMFLAGPKHGLGKVLNPCVDCKIFMLRHAAGLLGPYGASFLASGEVVGQRPMSQRPDAMARIAKEAGVGEVLLRPLCAQVLAPTAMERTGLVDRHRLHRFHGRGRRGQLELAAALGISQFPTPAGGCRLTDKEAARRYGPLLERLAAPTVADFRLANVGRQLWAGDHWLVIGRNQEQNEALEALAAPGDFVLRLAAMPGPTAVARPHAPGLWDASTLAQAAAYVAGFVARARQAVGTVTVAVDHAGQRSHLDVFPTAAPALPWAEPTWEACREWKRTAPMAQGLHS